MIFIFSPSIADLETADVTLQNFVEDLVDASLKGLHWIVVSRPAAKWILQNCELSGRQRAHLTRIHHEYTERKALAERTPALVEITLGDSDIRKNSVFLFSVGHRKIISSRILERSLLLLENSQTDGTLFALILEEVRKRIGIPRLHYQIVGAGGTNVIAETKNYADAGHAFYIILDGDYLSPFDEHSSVVKACETEIMSKNVIAGVSPLLCRDIENLFTLNFLKSTGVVNGEVQFDSYDIISSRRDATDPRSEPMLYFDMKEGLRCKKIAKLPQNPTRNWIEQTFTLPDDEGNFELRDIPGFGTNIITNVTSNGAAMKAFRMEVRSDSWFDFFGTPFVRAAWFLSAAAAHTT